MRVRLLNNGSYGDAENVKFPVEVKALRLTDNGLVKIHKDELQLIGFKNFDELEEWSFFVGTEAVLVEPAEQTDTPCDITNKCCNQFGERDEIQAIIDKLRADVAQRDERIAELESQCAKLLTQVLVI